MKSQADVETVRLQTELVGVEQELRKARLAHNAANQTEDTINEMLNDADSLRYEHQEIINKRTDHTNTLEMITGALPATARFTSIKIEAEQITVEGEADDPFTVTRYAAALEGQQTFSEVRIADIRESNVDESEVGKTESTRVSFSIVIHEQN